MKVYVWGTGFAAKELLENELKDISIEAFIDNHKGNGNFRVIHPEEVVKEDYDAIIVATGYAQEIYDQAVKMDFDMSKFIFVYNNYLFYDMNSNYALANKIFPVKSVNIIQNRYHVIRGMQQDEMKESTLAMCVGEVKSNTGNRFARNTGMYSDDYNRIRTFELVVDEILSRNIAGEVAELGVFRGEFAKYINAAFQDRKCYLFDTFEGFRESEAIEEKGKGNCGDAFIERFKDTSMDRVLQSMPFPDKIICKKGLFPESLDGLEERFAFVSLDVDFEEAMYEGLSYFYPRLNSGGYLFLHDYNSSTLRGVRSAVIKYEQDNNIKIAKVPIPDQCGTLVITK